MVVATVGIFNRLCTQWKIKAIFSSFSSASENASSTLKSLQGKNMYQADSLKKVVRARTEKSHSRLITN